MSHSDLGKRRLVSAIALGLAFVFIYSSSLHIGNPYSFLSHIHSYDVVAEHLAIVAAMLLPSMQLTIALSLLFLPTLRRAAFMLSTCLLALFFIFQMQAQVRGLNIACGCFSSGDENPINWITISRTGALLSISVLALVLDQANESPQNVVADKKLSHS